MGMEPVEGLARHPSMTTLRDIDLDDLSIC
jgi:hypothetical protein